MLHDGARCDVIQAVSAQSKSFDNALHGRSQHFLIAYLRVRAIASHKWNAYAPDYGHATWMGSHQHSYLPFCKLQIMDLQTTYNRSMSRFCQILAFGLALCAVCMPAILAAAPLQPNDFDVRVALDATEQSGSASAIVRIHARREVVWSLITSCTEALKMVPGLIGCDVLESAPDRSWQRIRHVLAYSWYVPKLTYEVRANYVEPSRVSIERISGDLRILKGGWTLQSEGEDTLAHYAVELAPGFWVPHWIVRAALRRDLPKMLRALRARAEAVQNTGGALAVLPG